MKSILLTLGVGAQSCAMACVTCNKPLQDAIYDSTFYPNLLTMLSAFIVLALIVALLSYVSGRRYATWIANSQDIPALNPVPLTTASTVLGIGLGGFLDGIVFHQILQWHEMLSAKIPVSTLAGKSVNMFWDGVFHFFCLIVVAIGLLLLWKLLQRHDIDRSGRLLGGGLLLGWGLFNIVEGVIDHHLLELHNVREITADREFWNLLFLGSAVLMIAIGLLLTMRKRNGRVKTE